MAVRITLSSPVPSTVPGDGWIVGYKKLGDPGSYTIVGPFMSVPIHIDTADAAGTLYEGYIERDCGDLTSTFFFWQTPCNCSDPGYVESPSGVQCEKNETQAPDVTNSGYCLATSQNSVYSQFQSRIYNVGFTATTINLGTLVSDSYIYADLTTAGQWANPGSSSTVGPMNRESVWIDSNCDGTPNALGSGVQTTVATLYNNVSGVNKTIYVGAGADNQFELIVNGVSIVDSGATTDRTFKIWHIMPITVVPGPNYINIVGTGDGTINDALAMVIYDNTNVEIAAASSDLDLNIPFHSSALRGTSFDVATCDTGWSLDTSGGQGNYICRRTTYEGCNTIPA